MEKMNSIESPHENMESQEDLVAKYLDLYKKQEEISQESLGIIRSIDRHRDEVALSPDYHEKLIEDLRKQLHENELKERTIMEEMVGYFNQMTLETKNQYLRPQE